MASRVREALGESERAWRENRPDVDAAANPVFSRLAVLARQLSAFHEGVLKPDGVSTTDYQLLATLWVRGPQTPKSLNRLQMMTTAGLTNALDRLQRSGWVRRRPNPADARSVVIELTADGSRFAERLSLIEMDRQSRVLASMSRGERRTVVSSLDQLIERLDEFLAAPH